MAGRKTKLTARLQKRLEEILKAGNYVETACRRVGIHPTTFFEWMKTKSSFAGAMDRARAQAEIEHVEIITGAAHECWQAAAWFLERSAPVRWGRRLRIDSSLVDEEIDRELARLAGGGEAGDVAPAAGEAGEEPRVELAAPVRKSSKRKDIRGKQRGDRSVPRK